MQLNYLLRDDTEASISHSMFDESPRRITRCIAPTNDHKSENANCQIDSNIPSGDNEKKIKLITVKKN